jgi:hypothetical protein
VDTWYAPLWSRRDLYTLIQLYFHEHDFAGMRDADLTKACPVFSSLADDPITMYLFGKKYSIDKAYFNPLRPGVFDLELKKG